MKKTAAEQNSVKSSPTGMAGLVLDTLFAVTERPEGLSIRQIAEATENSRSSTHRILQSLARDGYVEQDGTGSYVIGSRLLLLAARIFGNVPVLQMTNSFMRDLVDEIHETCYLAVYTENQPFVTYVNRIESKHPIRFVQPIGVRIPLHAGAVGKAILAECPDFDLAGLELTRYTENTLVSMDKLKEELARIIKKGYATSVEERVEGVAGAAAVIRSAKRIIGALTVSVPTARVDSKSLDRIGQAVKKYADQLSATLTSAGVERI